MKPFNEGGKIPEPKPVVVFTEEMMSKSVSSLDDEIEEARMKRWCLFSVMLLFSVGAGMMLALPLIGLGIRLMIWALP